MHRPTASVSGALDLGIFQRQIAEMEAATGPHYDVYQVAVRGEVHARSESGVPLHAFTPELVFRLSAT